MNTLPVSIDLETGGLGPNAPILAIGAVRFSTDGTPLVGEEHEFYMAISLEGQPPVDASTFYWWLSQPDEAREAVAKGKDGYTLPFVLQAFRYWLAAGTERAAPGMAVCVFEGEVWVRGDRDSVWLDEAHKRCGLGLPYKYSKVRDQRTLEKFAADRGVDIPWKETAHHALEDARHQALVLQAIFKAYPPLGEF